MIILSLIAGVVVINALVVTVAALRAPHGYEDADGFHLGDEIAHSEIGTIEHDFATHQEAA